MTVTRDHDVVRLQIAMNDPNRVCFRQSFSDLSQPFQQLWKLCSFTMNFVSQGKPINELHCYEALTVSFTDLVDMSDVG